MSPGFSIRPSQTATGVRQEDAMSIKTNYPDYKSVLIDLVGILKRSDMNGTLTVTLFEEGISDTFQSVMEGAQALLRQNNLLQQMEETWQVIADPVMTEAELLAQGFEIQMEDSAWYWWHANSATLSEPFRRKPDAMRYAELAVAEGVRAEQEFSAKHGVTVVLPIDPDGGLTGWISMLVTKKWLEQAVTNKGQQPHVQARQVQWSLPQAIDPALGTVMLCGDEIFVSAAAAERQTRLEGIPFTKRVRLSDLEAVLQRAPMGHVVPLGVEPYPGEAAIELVQDYCSRLSSVQSSYPNWLKIETQSMGFTALPAEPPKPQSMGETTVSLEGCQLTCEIVPGNARVKIGLTIQDVLDLKVIQQSCVREGKDSIRCGHLPQHWELPAGFDSKGCVQPLACVYADGTVTFSARNLSQRQIWITHRVGLENLLALVKGDGASQMASTESTQVMPEAAMQ